MIIAQWPLHAATIKVQVDKPGHKISPTLWGIFFEDINCSADAGIKCYLDNRLIQEAVYPEITSLHACASREKGTGDVIVKVVNASNDAEQTDLHLDGAANPGAAAPACVLTSGSGEDENSLDHPDRVACVNQSLVVKDSAIQHSFPAHSLTIIRVKSANY